LTQSKKKDQTKKKIEASENSQTVSQKSQEEAAKNFEEESQKSQENAQKSQEDTQKSQTESEHSQYEPEETEDSQKQKTTKTKSISQSSRAGVIFPVARIRSKLKKNAYGPTTRVSASSAVYMAAVMEYLSREVIIFSVEQMKEDNKKRLLPKHITSAINTDPDFPRLLYDVDIPHSRWFEPITETLIYDMTKNENVADKDTNEQWFRLTKETKQDRKTIDSLNNKLKKLRKKLHSINRKIKQRKIEVSVDDKPKSKEQKKLVVVPI